MRPVTVTPETLACLSPLSGLGTESLLQVVSLAKLESFQRGLKPLDFSWEHRVVYLLSGELKLGYPDGGNKVLVGGYDAALSPLGKGGADPVNVRAITDVQLLWFDENALDILVTWDQLAPPLPARADGEAGDAADWRAMSGIFDARHLTLGTFANLPAANIDSLLTCFKRQFVKAGDVIVRQNEPGDYYYVIERGRAQVTRIVAGAQIELAELKSGDAFGEEALIAETCRNATVTMKTDVLMWLRHNSGLQPAPNGSMCASLRNTGMTASPAPSTFRSTSCATPCPACTRTSNTSFTVKPVAAVRRRHSCCLSVACMPVCCKEG
jgi:Cyclic nucleotide-binding domain